MNFLRPRKRTLKVLLYSLRAFLPQNASYAQQPDDDVYKKGTRGRKFQADAAFSGRSMVEMLGVLAIIGVLSVGAISGYQKAMFKYKLNKQSEQLTTLLSNLNMYRQEWVFSTAINLMPYYIKLNAIPENMIKKNNTTFLYDVFNNRITLGTSGLITNSDGTTYTTSAGLTYYLNSDSSFDLCSNIFYNIKAFKEDVFRTVLSKKTEENPSVSYSDSFYGDRYCTTGRKCLKDANLTDIQNLCNYCENSTSCNIWVSFPVKDSYFK